MGGVVVTGIGCVTPIGIGVEAFAASLRAARSGIGPLTLCEASPFACKLAAEGDGFDPLGVLAARDTRLLPRVVQFAVAAARLAMEDARIPEWCNPARVAVILGTSSGPIAYALEQHAIFLERGIKRTHPSSPALGHNNVISSQC